MFCPVGAESARRKPLGANNRYCLVFSASGECKLPEFRLESKLIQGPYGPRSPGNRWKLTIEPLKYGKTEAKESEPLKPVPEAFVDETIKHCAPQIAAMIELQRLTGMRSGEVTIMRSCDISMAGAVWEYRPLHHKTAYRGHVVEGIAIIFGSTR